MQTPKTIVFRVDSSVDMGAGHVYRCMTLADQLKDQETRILFLCRGFKGNIISVIEKCGFEVVMLDNTGELFAASQSYESWLGVPYNVDAEQCISVINEFFPSGADLVVVDHYGIDSRWHFLISKITKNILVIDDLANRPLYCDYLLDQTFGRELSSYLPVLEKKPKETLLGSDYSLLRPGFYLARNLVKRTNLVARPSLRVLVSLGGSDPDNITGLALAALDSVNGCSQELYVDVVLGASNQNVALINRQVNTLSIDVTVHVNSSAMADLMRVADFAIGAAGTTTWERCCLGLPTLTVCLADNQKEIIGALSDHGCIHVLNVDDLTKPETFKTKLQLLLSDSDRITSKSMKLVDGLGVNRVIQRLLTENTKDGSQIKLRTARLADKELLFKWQCSSSTRAYARNPKVPTWAEHENWFDKKLRDSESIFCIVEMDGASVGMVRLDKVFGEPYHEISVLVAPEFYRRGIAEAAISLLIRIYPDLKIVATVLVGNKASHALFCRLGFKKIGNEQYIKL